MNNKGADQPAHPHSLISAFVVHCLDNTILQLKAISLDCTSNMSIYCTKSTQIFQRGAPLRVTRVTNVTEELIDPKHYISQKWFQRTSFQKIWAFFLPVTSETNVTKVDSMETVNILYPIPCNKKKQGFSFSGGWRNGWNKSNEKNIWAIFLPETSETNVTKVDSMEMPIFFIPYHETKETEIFFSWRMKK